MSKENHESSGCQGANCGADGHSVACLYQYTLSSLGLTDTPQMRVLFWDAHNALAWDEKTDHYVVPEAPTGAGKIVGHRVYRDNGSLVGEYPVTEQAPKLTLDDINAVIVSEHYFTAGQGDARAVEDAAFSGGVLHASGRATPDDLAHVTFCVLILRNGAKVTGVNHGPVSAANFDPLVGREMARQIAVDKVFELEGYLLRERLYAKVQP